MKKVLIVGATSAIAESCARVWAQRGDALFLVGRNRPRLEAIAADLTVRGGRPVSSYALDLNDLASLPAMLAAAELALGGLDTVLIAHGTLSDQAQCQESVDLLVREFQTNAVSAIAIMTLVANRFEARGSGSIGVISSVAGERGRQSNYVYGSAKAAVTCFASGMRQRLAKAGVQVITIKPGLVATPMTAAFKKGPLWATASDIAPVICKALDDNGRDLFVPWFWWGIMAIIKAIPETVFRKLKL